MKKILYLGLIMISIVGMSSCDYDDSNDLDVITPNDSTETIVEKSNPRTKKTPPVSGFFVFWNSMV